MLDPHDVPAEALLPKALLQEVGVLTARGGQKVLALLFLFIGSSFAVLLCTPGMGGQHLQVQESTIDMASRIRFQPIDMWGQISRLAPVPGFAAQRPAVTPPISRPLAGSSSGHLRMSWRPSQVPQALPQSAEPLVQPYEPGTLTEFVNTSSGVQMPRLICKTAMKKELNEILLTKGVRGGFRGIDITGEQDEYEPGIGKALRSLFATGVTRKKLFIQTKVHLKYSAELSFAKSLSNKGEPADVQLEPDVPMTKLVESSIANSLSNLGVEYIDSLVVPYTKHEQTMEAWRAMEAAVQAGLVRQLGISNVKSLSELRELYAEAAVKPAVVLGEAVVRTGFERQMQTWCAEVGIYFQSFWTLDANIRLMTSKTVQGFSKKYGVSPTALFYRYMMGVGAVAITPTLQNMQENLVAWRVPLEEEDAGMIDELLMKAETVSWMDDKMRSGTP